MFKTLHDINFTIELSDGRSILVRHATINDALELKRLYVDVYAGHYTLDVINNINEMKIALQSTDYFWLVLQYGDNLIGSLIFLINRTQRLGKVFAAIIREDFRGHNLTEQMIEFGIDLLVKKRCYLDIIYATTRTLSPAPQKLVERRGFVKLGIFPNVRKVKKFETHGLAAFFSEQALKMRKRPVVLLPQLAGLYDIILTDLDLGPANIYQENIDIEDLGDEEFNFEIIKAPRFILQRFNEKRKSNQMTIHFLPFHVPNLLLINSDLSFEVYCHYSETDMHCAIIGYTGKKKIENYTAFLNSVSFVLEEIGVRYIEILVGAYNPKRLIGVLKAGFLPSAYFPAMRLITPKERNPFFSPGDRLDYIVFSKSFEILDFHNIKLEGKNRDYLKYYFDLWKALYIDKSF